MTELSEKEFLKKLVDVVYKLRGIANTQGARFSSKWDEYLKSINPNPHKIRQIKLDKEKFIEDINYRIYTLEEVEKAFVDGFYSIKSLLETLYKSYFLDSELFKTDFSKEDQLMLKYYVARDILGNLVQYNQIDHETVPLKYNLVARNYLIIKLKGQFDTEILETMKKLQIKDISVTNINEIMEEVQADGIVTKTIKDNKIFYTLNREVKLSTEGKEKYNKVLRALVEWPTQMWRSFYNIRELNVTINEEIPHLDFLHQILSRTATQGFTAADYVFKNLIKYYKELR
jgi:hypothetical protein